ncbi:DNA replication complex GINS family protein [Candidatus Woesearchaeota archaeon]|nr:DNA replication complex GINS family protein [Candidatus Woesearchaeota archaeon]
MAQEVIITYETLFELLKRERERPDLQKLEPAFFSDTISYIKDKKKVLEAKSDSVFAAEERKKTERQLENIYKIIKELYERREKKIINLALDKSRTKSSLIDTTALLKEEKVVFDAIANLLDTYRDAILYSVLNEKMPFMDPFALKPKDDFKSALELKKSKKSTKLVRFLGHIPKFAGPELEEYGPFEEEDIANLPAEVADVLISKGKSEEINEE